MTKDEKQKRLEEIAKEIEETGGGPLKALGINAVPGEGSPEAEIMFIGEAPGFHENEQRRPFVGQAGKLLRKALATNGWREDEVYITNVIKFRPPENRDPYPAEIEFFKPFLDRQIETIAPKVIVTLGRYSMHKFIGEGVSISRIHGQPRKVEWNGKIIIVFPMFHPAAALRGTGVMNQFLEDFAKMRAFVDNGAIEEETAPQETAKPAKEPEPFGQAQGKAEQLKLV